ncbi:hypothetical protein Rhal01_02040 [Rubritalea halochordaticola]|uniref:Uncharacterized protein n=1 Tax=Rubritalea halochordaticola TaxID=714537 RepID=A0ABP9V1L2_9BACT
MLDSPLLAPVTLPSFHRSGRFVRFVKFVVKFTTQHTVQYYACISLVRFCTFRVFRGGLTEPADDRLEVLGGVLRPVFFRCNEGGFQC